MDDLTPVLSRLPEPMPSSTLTATVMARVHREVERKREAERRADSQATMPVKRARELQTWLWTFAGIALVLIVFIKGWLSSPTLPNFASARIGIGRAALMPVGAGVSLLLALGLITYLAGLFAPLRGVGRE